VLAAALLALGSCGLAPESSFDLAPASRLPRWIVLPPGLSRRQVSLKLDYYTSPVGRTATFTLYDTNGRPLGMAKCYLRGAHPLKLNNSPPGFAPGYPVYEVVTVGEAADVVEHRAPEPFFHMTDDASVREALGVPANPQSERP
jgi:hypothetical protein